MLKLTLEPKFTVPVEITVPGQEETGTMNITFNYRNSEELTDFWKKNEKTKLIDMVGEVVDGWDLAEDFNGKNLKTFLINYPSAALEILTVYREMSVGSRVKNSKLLPLV